MMDVERRREGASVTNAGDDEAEFLFFWGVGNVDVVARYVI